MDKEGILLKLSKMLVTTTLLEENDRGSYFMINLHESKGPGWDRTCNPWICSQTYICSQTCYRLRYAARYTIRVNFKKGDIFIWTKKGYC